MKTLRLLLCGLALALAAAPPFVTPAAAHEGHEHGEPEPGEAPAPSVEAPEAGAPRLALAQPPVELVAVQGGDGLLIYADDYASNAPLAGLHVQVQLGARLLDASEVAPGSYRVARDLIGAAGGAVHFSLHGADHDAGYDVELSGELPPAPAEPAPAAGGAAAAPPRLDRWTMLFGLLLAAASLAGGWTVKRRR